MAFVLKVPDAEDRQLVGSELECFWVNFSELSLPFFEKCHKIMDYQENKLLVVYDWLEKSSLIGNALMYPLIRLFAST